MAARRGLHGVVVDDLGRRIVHHEIVPGTQLPLDELGEQYGVSRTVVRETVRVLEAKGLIAARQNVGTRVLAEESWHALDVDVLRWRLSGPDAQSARQDLLELRSAVEPTAARLAALRRDAETADRLVAAAQRMRDALGPKDVDVFTAADVDFHATLFQAAGNPLIAELLSLVGAALDDRIQVVASHGISAVAVDLHCELAAAVAAGDADRAASTAGDLIVRSYEDSL
ncbi:FadR/GntR family transcriptional regulator [Microbacterium oxydans]|jgi:DNA-binding FadR family transcriptional regulator|uniref:FadR/GntR family transcriptional regulator n=1 Tax=Microbacterium oxydans TaxID=82380 RepID=UPI00226B6807|nr:FadR/GntR family transcriptional regulator [Microbacterium oxydans]WAA66052.1 FadR family transcriptional regulator [Microbacterium oxydans]